MKRIFLALAIVLTFTGCASTDYAQYASIHVERSKTEAARYDALASIARHSNDQTTRVAAADTTADEWLEFTGTFTYVSSTSFTVSGDQTSIFQVSRKLKTQNTAGIAYSNIASATYSAPDTTVTVTTSKAIYVFSSVRGELTSMVVEGKELIKSGLVPNFWRGMTDNDIANKAHLRCKEWHKPEFKMSDFKIAAERDKVTISSTCVVNQSKIDLRYCIAGDGALQVKMHFTPADDKVLSEMPRFGMRVILDKSFDKFTWLGRGPGESYMDRKSGELVGLYSGDVWSQLHRYNRPQESGNKSDVEWASLRDQDGTGIMAGSNVPLSVSAWNLLQEDLEYVPMDIEHRHGGSLEKRDLVWFNIDLMQQGVGGDNTWGAPVHSEYTISPVERSYMFVIRPLRSGDDEVKESKNVSFFK